MCTKNVLFKNVLTLGKPIKIVSDTALCELYIIYSAKGCCIILRDEVKITCNSIKRIANLVCKTVAAAVNVELYIK